MKQENIKNKIKFAKGFTLIELLVVVVIIGILAAIALPQYKVAVTKSKFATLKQLTKSILDAEERFYMANGNYTDNMTKLDIDIGGKATNNNTTRTFPWGKCEITLYNVENNKFYVFCRNANIKMSYQIYPKHVENGARLCVYYGTNISSVQYKVCSQETEHQAYDGTSYYFWYY